MSNRNYASSSRQNQFVELRAPDDLPYREFVVLERTENSVGSVMQPGEPLFKLIPLGADMEVEIEIQGRDIARLKQATTAEIAEGIFPNGSEARVKLNSFPCLLYTSPSPRDQRGSRMPSSA